MTTFAVETGEELDKRLDFFFAGVLEKGDVDGLFVMKKTADSFCIPTLITDAKDVVGVSPFAAVMPINSAALISQITRLRPSPQKIAVVLKPCEYRALIELVKLKQVSLDNLVLIVSDCMGTFPLTEYLEIIGNKKTPDILNALDKDDRVRVACQTCELCVPEGDRIDIAMCLLGSGLKKELVVEGRSDTGVKLLEKLGLKEKAMPPEREEKVKEFVEKRRRNNLKVMDDVRGKVFGLDNLGATLSKCISCHNCMTVCPICYCKECFFESPTFEYDAEKYLRWAERKGSIRMPVATFLFHIGRMNHMAVSCVGCGMCEQACPSKIPLLSMFKAVGAVLQKVFDYQPGRKLDESLPLIVYKDEELEPE